MTKQRKDLTAQQHERQRQALDELHLEVQRQGAEAETRVPAFMQALDQLLLTHGFTGVLITFGFVPTLDTPLPVQPFVTLSARSVNTLEQESALMMSAQGQIDEIVDEFATMRESPSMLIPSTQQAYA